MKEWASVEAARERAAAAFGPAWPAVLDAFEKLPPLPTGPDRFPDVERLLAEANVALAEAALVAGKGLRPAVDAAVEAVRAARAAAVNHGRLRRLAEQSTRILNAEGLRAGVRGPSDRGNTDQRGRVLAAMRRNLVVLARLEASGRTHESCERGKVQLPDSHAEWTVAGIALGIDAPPAHFTEFRRLQRLWRDAH